MPQNLLHHIHLALLNKGNDFHLAPAIGALQRIDIVDHLYECRPARGSIFS